MDPYSRQLNVFQREFLDICGFPGNRGSSDNSDIGRDKDDKECVQHEKHEI